MHCDFCKDRISEITGGDWVDIEGGKNMCTPCASKEVAELRTRVRELEGAIKKHKKSMGGPGPVSRTDFILWEVLKGPTQEG